MHYALKKDIVASKGTVPISEGRANIPFVRLIVVVHVTVVEVHVPSVVGIILRT